MFKNCHPHEDLRDIKGWRSLLARWQSRTWAHIFLQKHKRHPISKDKEEATGQQPQQNQIPYPPGGWPTERKIIVPQNLPLDVKVLSPKSGFADWESGNGRRCPQRIQLWRPEGFVRWNATRLEETDLVCTRAQGKRSVSPLREQARPAC